MKVGLDELSKGMIVWYRYSKYNELEGPYTIIGFNSSHQGLHVLLKKKAKPVLSILLADDDDFGTLLFYTSNTTNGV